MKWEYRSYLFEPGEGIIPKLNQLGADGWEACYFEPMRPDGKRSIVFKRRVST